MDNKALERISFLFPFKINEKGIRQPILVYDVSDVPHPVDINVAIFFIGLISEKLYRVDISIIGDDGKILNADTENQKLFKVKSSIDGETVVSASFEVRFNGITMPCEGVYCIAASLHAEGKSSLISTNEAYFEVKTRGQG